MAKILPVFNMLVLDTCTVISVDDGLLRTSTGCAGPSDSLTLYTDWLKDTVMSIRTIKFSHIYMYVCAWNYSHYYYPQWLL